MDNTELRHISDPSSLTTQQLWREIASLEKLIITEREGDRREIQTQIDAIKEAIKIAHEDLVRVPTDVQRQVGNLKDLHDEKFTGINRRFDERDERDKQNAQNVKVALEVAMQAAKELVTQQNVSAAQAASKQEATFSKQIEQLINTFQISTKSLEDKIAGLHERQVRIESKGEGRKDFWGYIVAGILLIIAILTYLGRHP